MLVPMSQHDISSAASLSQKMASSFYPHTILPSGNVLNPTPPSETRAISSSLVEISLSNLTSLGLLHSGFTSVKSRKDKMMPFSLFNEGNGGGGLLHRDPGFPQ